MTSTDIVVVVVGLVVGYFVVSWMLNAFSRGARPTRPAADAPRPPPGSGPGSAPDPGGPRPWYEVLQVPVYASLDDVKLAYRRSIAEYHPDRTGNLAPELRELAEARSKEINVAYAAALRAFGQRGDGDRPA